MRKIPNKESLEIEFKSDLGRYERIPLCEKSEKCRNGRIVRDTTHAGISSVFS